MKQVLTYLLAVTIFYYIVFIVSYLISNQMEKRRIHKEDELLKYSIKNVDNSLNIKTNEFNKVIEKYHQKMKKNEKICFYFSFIILIIFIFIVVIGFISKGKSLYSKFLVYLYYGLPIIGYNILSNGVKYYRKHYIKKIDTK